MDSTKGGAKPVFIQQQMNPHQFSTDPTNLVHAANIQNLNLNINFQRANGSYHKSQEFDKEFSPADMN